MRMQTRMRMVWWLVRVTSPKEASDPPLAPVGQAGLAGNTSSCPLLHGSCCQWYGIPWD